MDLHWSKRSGKHHIENVKLSNGVRMAMVRWYACARQTSVAASCLSVACAGMSHTNYIAIVIRSTEISGFAGEHIQ